MVIARRGWVDCLPMLGSPSPRSPVSLPWSRCASAALVVALGACGGPSVEVAPAASIAAGADAPDEPATPEPEAFELPELPEPAPEAEAPRTPPAIPDVAAAARALDGGFYDAVREALPSLRSSTPAARLGLLEARLAQATGRYDDAASFAEQAAEAPELALEARTLRAEALAARGRYDEAERVLTALVTDPSAHRARVLLARLDEARGRGAEADALYMRVIEAYNSGAIGEQDGEGLAYVAMAAVGLGSARDANQAFQEATRADPARVETQLEWARLFLSKYDPGHAEECVRAALAVNPESPEGRALLARVKIEQSYDFVAAKQEASRALAVNPSLVMAHVTLAGIALRDLDVEAADGHLARALAVNPEDLEALSVRAAVRYLAGDEPGFRRAQEEVLRRNRGYSAMYAILSDFADWEHRYPDMVRFAREAVTRNPADALAQATLGLNLLRLGEEREGLEALREAWRRDHYNVMVYNTLNLYDDVIATSYESVERAPFVFRMHREERPLLERYVPGLLEAAYRDMVRRYHFTPEGPIHVELYASPEHFSVRTAGLPSIGVQGVCFGKVVTALSPRGGPFNWAQITWHELAHVFHIQLSRNRVPRWFTEGLAEYETTIAGHGWRRELDHRLFAALEAGRLPPLALLNRAFTAARSAEEMMVAYYAASRVVGYIVERFGFDRVVAMLRAFGRDLDAPAVVAEALGISIDALDRDFRAHLRERLAPYAGRFHVDFLRYEDVGALEAAAEAAPEDAGAQAALAAGAFARGDAERAEHAATAALARDPGQPLARYVLARVAVARRSPESQAQVERLLADGHDGYDVRMLGARAAALAHDAAALGEHLRAATRLDPLRPEAWQGLIEIAGRHGDAALRLEALRALAAIDEHGREVHAELLEALIAHGDFDGAVAEGRRALFVDPERAENHLALAEALLHTGRADEALFELESAELADERARGLAELGKARALLALGRRAEAEAAARAAVAADPRLESQATELLAR
jgi:tetratricopeptide (TPR) repeat protein